MDVMDEIELQNLLNYTIVYGTPNEDAYPNRLVDEPFNTDHDFYEAVKEEYNVCSYRLKLDEESKLGSGHFGIVYYGTVQCKRTNLPVPVAVKMVKIEQRDEDEMTSSTRELDAKMFANQIETLRSELSTMAYLQRQKQGQHPNLIRLIATTKLGDENKFCLMTEYCEYGSVRDYLRRKYQNKQFVNDINIVFNDTDQESNKLISKPNSNDENCQFQSEHIGFGDYITTSNLMSFAGQIASAMEYLSSKNILHRDVALRNIFLKSNMTIKLGDFGLARQIDDANAVYQCNKGEKLPFQYMALETLTSKNFNYTIQSEIWAFGICLWELFTYAQKMPYELEIPDFTREQLIGFLNAGCRLSPPEIMLPTIQNLMLSTWNETPALRPSFHQCKLTIHKARNNGNDSVTDEKRSMVAAETVTIPSKRDKLTVCTKNTKITSRILCGTTAVIAISILILIALSNNSERFDLPLLQAVKDGNADTVRALLKSNSSAVNEKDANGWTLLHWAAFYGHNDTLIALLEYGANVLLRNIDGKAPIHVAAEEGRIGIFSLRLLAHDSNATNVKEEKYGWTPLHYAAANGHKAIAIALIESGANVNKTCNYKNDSNGIKPSVTALHLAARYGHTETVSALVKFDAAVGGQDSGGNTPLHLAVMKNYSSIVHVIFESNPTLSEDILNIRNNANLTALEIAIDNVDEPSVRELVKAGINVNLIDKHGDTPLYRAVENGNIDIVTLLLQSNANVSIKNYNGLAPIHLAAANGREDMIGVLLDYVSGVVNATNNNNWTPLHLAAGAGNREIVIALLDRGADVDATANYVDDPNGTLPLVTALHLASRYGHMETVRALLNRSANVNAMDKYNMTPLHWAAANGYTEIVIYLLDKGGNVNATANYENDLNGILPSITALHLAAMNGHAETARVLLNRTANVDAKDKYNCTPLHWAAAKGYTEIVIYLLDKGGDVNATANYKNDPNGILPSITALHLAAKNVHVETVRALLNRSANVNARDKYNMTPLHWAAYQEYTEIVIDLLDKGGDINATANYVTDPNGTQPSVTALHLAARYGRAEIVRVLLNRSANIDARDISGNTPLHLAGSEGKIDVVQLLVESHANTSIENKDGWTALEAAILTGNDDQVISYLVQHTTSPLHRAVRKNNFQIAKRLISIDARLNERDRSNMTALEIAIDNGYVEMVRVLVSAGANLTLFDKDGYTPVHSAIRKSKIKILKLILEYDSSVVNATDKDNMTPLHWAAAKGYTEIVIYLLDKGGDVNALANYGSDPNGTLPSVTALHLASRYGHMGTVRALLNRSANVNAKDKYNMTPLHWAAANGYTAILIDLLNKGGDINATANYANEPNGTLPSITALHFAARYGHAEIVRVLLNRSANVDAMDRRNWTPLHSAAKSGNTEIVIYLLDKGGDVNATGNYANDPNNTLPSVTALHLAAMDGHTAIVRILLNRSANVNAMDADNKTPLHLATWKGYAEIVIYLLDKGSDINATAYYENDPNGTLPLATALHLAAMKGHTAIVHALLNRGANVNAKDRYNWTALHLAVVNGHTETVRALLNRSTNVDARDKKNLTPLHLAAWKGYTVIAIDLLNKGADVNGMVKYTDEPNGTLPSVTALHFAARYGHAEIVRVLLSNGADASTQDRSGDTPLHYATISNKTDIVRLMISKNPNLISIRNSNDETPLDIAKSKGYDEIAQVLINADAPRKSINAADSHENKYSNKFDV